MCEHRVDGHTNYRAEVRNSELVGTYQLKETQAVVRLYAHKRSSLIDD